MISDEGRKWKCVNQPNTNTQRLKDITKGKEGGVRGNAVANLNSISTLAQGVRETTHALPADFCFRRLFTPALAGDLLVSRLLDAVGITAFRGGWV